MSYCALNAFVNAGAAHGTFNFQFRTVVAALCSLLHSFSVLSQFSFVGHVFIICLPCYVSIVTNRKERRAHVPLPLPILVVFRIPFKSSLNVFFTRSVRFPAPFSNPTAHAISIPCRTYFCSIRPVLPFSPARSARTRFLRVCSTFAVEHRRIED